jgi:hypothetical protein
VVYKGLLEERPSPSFLVAVKSLHGTASGSDRQELLEEAAVMCQFQHPNIVRLQLFFLKERCHPRSSGVL